MDELETFTGLRPSVAVLSADERDLLWSRVVDQSPQVTAETEHSDEIAPVTPITRGPAHRAPRRTTLVVAAAAVAALVVGGLVMLSGRNNDAKVSPAGEVSIPAAATTELPSGPILSTSLAAQAAPMFVPTEPGWTMTGAYASHLPLHGGGFGTVYWGAGPTYDAAIFAATVVYDTAGDAEASGQTVLTVPSLPGILENGEKVAVAGTTGAVYAERGDGTLATRGPAVTLFWPIDSARFARVNAQGLTVEQVIAFANQLTLEGDTLAMSVPAGFHQVEVPVRGERSHISYVFERDGRSIEIIGENGGVSSLLSRVLGELRTTRIISGVEVANFVHTDSPTRDWVDWLAGDWSYYALGDGFTSVEEFDRTLASIAYTDPATFAQAGAGIGIVLPGEHRDLAEQVLSFAPVSPESVDLAAHTKLAMSLDSYGFELFQGAVCTWNAQFRNFADNNQPTDPIVAAVRAAVERNTGTPFERAAQVTTEPFLSYITGDVTDPTYSTDCPTWVINR